jgi:hypothetical protein
MMGLGGDDGKMEPALGRPGWVIAEKERVETISFSVQPGPNKGWASITRAVRRNGLQRKPDPSFARRNPWMRDARIHLYPFLQSVALHIARRVGIFGWPAAMVNGNLALPKDAGRLPLPRLLRSLVDVGGLPAEQRGLR